MVVKIMVKIFGGIWEVKEKADSKRGLIKKFYLILLLQFLEIKNSYIGPKAQINSVPILPHGLSGVFISGDAIIGSNCVIFHQVTIGSNNIPGSKTTGAPIIGNNVYIGTGAKIIGGITIGDNVRIGANAVVVKDIPSNSVVINQPVLTIEKENLDNRFYERNGENWQYYQDGKIIKETNNELIEQLNRESILRR